MPLSLIVRRLKERYHDEGLMKEIIKSIVIAVFSSLWLLAFHSAGLKCLLVSRHQYEPTQVTQEHLVGWFDAARRDFNIGIVWLLVVVSFWVFRLSRAGSRNQPDRESKKLTS